MFLHQQSPIEGLIPAPADPYRGSYFVSTYAQRRIRGPVGAGFSHDATGSDMRCSIAPEGDLFSQIDLSQNSTPDGAGKPYCLRRVSTNIALRRSAVVRLGVNSDE